METINTTFFIDELSDTSRYILNTLLDESISTQKKIINFLITQDPNGLKSEKEIRKAIDSYLPPTAFYWLVRYFRSINSQSTKYLNLEDAEVGGHFNRDYEPLIYFAPGSWELKDSKPKLKLGEKFLMKYNYYSLILPITMPKDIELDGPFKIATFYNSLLKKYFIKCYYRSQIRDIEEYVNNQNI